MLHAERLEKIRDYLFVNKYAIIQELADERNTSSATIEEIYKECTEDGPCIERVSKPWNDCLWKE